MNLNLEQTGVGITPEFMPMLKNLQSNILKGHGRNFAHHLFFKINEGDGSSVKNWIAEFARNFITSSEKQLIDSQKFKEGEIADGGTVYTLSLSANGYRKLGLGSSAPSGAAFQGGMASRASLLRDGNDIDEAFLNPVDLLIIVADDYASRAKDEADRLILALSTFATLTLNQRGNVLKLENGTGIEHFGYADGISQPLYTAKEISGQGQRVSWDDAALLNRLLERDPGTDASDAFGSFLVFRKLEQNVLKFKQDEGGIGSHPKKLPEVKNKMGKDEPELAGAMLVGRFENGTPVALNSEEQTSQQASLTNDFDYGNDLQANKCPFHAHTRIMNPRNGDPIAGDLKALRITRRGIPYDDFGRFQENEILRLNDQILERDLPETNVGLLFMCYQSSIENQFEILQAHWANEGNIAGHIIQAEDSLISQGRNPLKTLPEQWGKGAQSDPFDFSHFVSFKGGEYFFTPSISFLKSLV